MNKKARFALVLSLLVCGILVSCGPSQAELDSQATKTVAEIFATQTARVPTQTQTQAPTLTPPPTIYPKELLDLGIDYFNNGEFESAIQQFDKAIDINPQTAEAYFYRGFVFARLDDFDQAIADYDQAILLEPQYVEAYLNRARVYDDLGEIDLAIADFDQAILLNPQSAEAYLDKGMINGIDIEMSIANLEKALELDLRPELRKLAERLLEIHKFSIQLDEVIECGLLTDVAGEVIDRATKNVNQSAAAILIRTKNYFQGPCGTSLFLAILELQEALKTEPGDYNIYLLLGMAYYGGEDFKQAIALFDGALSFNRQDALVYYFRGFAFADDSIGEYDKAIADLTQALELGLSPELQERAEEKILQLR